MKKRRLTLASLALAALAVVLAGCGLWGTRLTLASLALAALSICAIDVAPCLIRLTLASLALAALAGIFRRVAVRKATAVASATSFQTRAERAAGVKKAV